MTGASDAENAVLRTYIADFAKANEPVVFTFISTDGDSVYEVVKADVVKYGTVDTVTSSKVVVKVDGSYITMKLTDSDDEATEVKAYSGIAKDDKVAVEFGKDYFTMTSAPAVSNNTEVSKGTITYMAKQVNTLASATSSDYTFGGVAYKLWDSASADTKSAITSANVGKDFEYYVIPALPSSQKAK
jgi:hypothetical protein